MGKKIKFDTVNIWLIFQYLLPFPPSNKGMHSIVYVAKKSRKPAKTMLVTSPLPKGLDLEPVLGN